MRREAPWEAPPRVYIYRNLRTKRWVIAGKPKASAEWPNVDSLVLPNVTFRISEAARPWSLTHRLPSGKPYRQVHAYAVGELYEGTLPECEHTAISYNSDPCGAFTRRDNNAPVDRCEFVHFTATRRRGRRKGAWMKASLPNRKFHDVRAKNLTPHPRGLIPCPDISTVRQRFRGPPVGERASQVALPWLPKSSRPASAISSGLQMDARFPGIRPANIPPPG